MNKGKNMLDIKKLGTQIGSCVALAIAISSCFAAPINSRTQPPIGQSPSQQWRRMNAQEQSQTWEYILNSPLGIAALNQLAVEGFISPTCPKTFYLNEESGGFQTILRVKCPTARGVSTAIAYDEMRVIFNRFESNIENFEVRRISQERPPQINLPE